MDLNKILIIDGTEIFHQAVFVKRKVPKLSVPYFMLRKLFKIVKAFPDRKVIFICDGKHSWRKQVYPCLTEDVDVLTRDGWQNIKEIVDNKKKIEIATLNQQTNKVDYRKIKKFYCYPYAGDMFKFGGKHSPVDLIMTPDHKHYQRTKGTIKFKLKEAKNISTRSAIEFNREFIYDNREQDTFILPEFRNETHSARMGGIKVTEIWEHPPKYFKMDDWLKLLGWYLAEGCFGSHGGTKNPYKFCITQSFTHNPKYCDEIRQVLKDNNLQFYESKKTNVICFDVSGMQLSTYLKQFGKSREKFIPRELLDTLSKRQCSILLSALLKGDGTIIHHKRIDSTWSYTTVSKQLANDVQELAFKAGFISSIVKCSNFYFVYVGRNGTPSTYKHRLEDWTGNVYDIEVPNHIFFVRRNGKCCWTGNCYKAGRQANKDKQTDIDWGYHYQEMDLLLDNLVAFTPIVVLKEVGLESDDWASYLTRHGEDTILCSSDHDMDQLCLFPGVKLVSLKSPKLNPLRVKDPIGSLNDKIKNGCTTDKVPKATTPEQESINRIIVTLTSLPIEIDQKMEKILVEYKESTASDGDLKAFADQYNFKFLLAELKKLFGEKK